MSISSEVGSLNRQGLELDQIRSDIRSFRKRSSVFSFASRVVNVVCIPLAVCNLINALALAIFGNPLALVPLTLFLLSSFVFIGVKFMVKIARGHLELKQQETLKKISEVESAHVRKV